MKQTYAYVIAAILIIVLAAYGIYRIYQNKQDEKPLPLPSPTSSPVGFYTSPSPMASPTPVLGTTPPANQPSTGIGSLPETGGN